MAPREELKSSLQPRYFSLKATKAPSPIMPRPETNSLIAAVLGTGSQACAEGTRKGDDEEVGSRVQRERTLRLVDRCQGSNSNATDLSVVHKGEKLKTDARSHRSTVIGEI
jgi:hypothetical protein